MTANPSLPREENIKTLVSLGITGTQAKICLALAQIGAATISEIADAAEVARPDTYRAALELEKKGLLEKILSTPARYELLHLSEVLAILIERKESENRDLQEKTANLLKEFENFTDKQPTGGDQFVLVPTGKAFSNRLQKLIENSQKSINIITSQKVLEQFLDLVLVKNKETIGKEVHIRIVTEKRKNKSLTKRIIGLQQKIHLETRFLDILPPFSLVTFDEKEILLSTQTRNRNDSFVVYSNNVSLVELSRSHFNDSWFSADEPPGLTFKRTKMQFDYLCANMLNGFAYCKMIFKNGKPTDFIYLQINEAFERITGLNRGQVIGKGVLKVIPGIEGANPELFEIYGRVASGGKSEELETFVKPLNLWLHLSIYSPKKGYFAVIFEDITERKKAESEREIMIQFLKIANATNSTRDLIKLTVDFFQTQSGCQAVGIRLKDGDDYPYYETRGFPQEHVKLENRLCLRDDSGCIVHDFKGDPVIECMCGNVICRRFDPTKKFFTKKGSFWANDTTRLLATTTPADRQTNTRNRCNGEGYESVALIALRVGNHRLGLLQLNDKRKNIFTLEKIEMWERVADSLALGLSKTIAEESLCKYAHM
jgi:PAS domain S-box-containing protein